MTEISRFAILLALPLSLLAAQEEENTDSAVWNRGVDQYRDGGTTNVLETLRPIMLSRTHGARAAEVVGKIHYDMARRPGETSALHHLEEAAAAAQIALKADPGNPRLRDNFARAASDLPSLRETARINALLEREKNKDPFQLIAPTLESARRIAKASLGYTTNAPASAVALADSLSAQMLRIADVATVLKGIAASAPAQDGGAANAEKLTEFLENLRVRAGETAESLADLSEEARYGAAEVEDSMTRIFKSAVMPPQAIRIDQTCQSNAWLDVEEEFSRPWQDEACDYTAAFRTKFPLWADAYMQKAASDTNMPPFTAEAKEEIVKLSGELAAVQALCRKENLPPKQEEALELIRRIIELMPEEKNRGGGGQSGQKQNENDNRDNSKDSGQDDNQQGGQDQQQDSGGGDEQEKEQDGKDEPQPQEGEEEESAEEKEISAVLKQAQERSDEHDERKKLKINRAILPPNEKDW